MFNSQLQNQGCFKWQKITRTFYPHKFPGCINSITTNKSKVVASYMISCSSFGLHTTLCEIEMFYLTAVFYDDENNASGMINVLIPTCWRNVDEMNMTFID